MPSPLEIKSRTLKVVLLITGVTGVVQCYQLSQDHALPLTIIVLDLGS